MTYRLRTLVNSFVGCKASVPQYFLITEQNVSSALNSSLDSLFISACSLSGQFLI